MTRGRFLWVVVLVVALLAAGCQTAPPPTGSLQARAEHPQTVPHGVTHLVAERAGAIVPATWTAASGRVVTDADGSTAWIAPEAPGRYALRASHGSDSVEVEVVVASAVEVVESVVGPAGGEVELAGGERVTFSAGALTGASSVSLARFAVAPAEYGAGVSRISGATRLTLSGAPVDLAGSGITIYLPAMDAIEGSTATLVEIRVALRDGSTHVLLESYSPLSSETSVISLPAGLFAALDEAYGLAEPMSIVLQPLDIGAAATVSPSAVRYVTGLFRVDLDAASMADAVAVCDSGPQRMPSWVTPAVATPSRQPVVLVHGWQVLANFGASLADDLRIVAGLVNPLTYLLLREAETPQRNPAFCGWAPLINHLADIGLGDHAELYVFGYDSERHVGENAALLRTAIQSTFGGQAPIIVAHSMGGLVADAAHFQGLAPRSVLTLGTPYRGSLALNCGLSNPFSHRCLVASVHPSIALMTLYPLELLGLRMVLVRALTSYQGTRDLTWDDSFFSSNAFLKHIHASPARDLSAFTAFYGDLSSDTSGSDAVTAFMQSAFFGPLGHASDGIVSVNSGTLDLGDAHGVRVGATRRFVGADHNAVKGGSDLTAPPSCRATQSDPLREKACEAMRAVGEYLLERIGVDGVAVTVSPASATLPPSGSQSFTATVTGTANTSVSWSATCGSVPGTGNPVTYTAPGTAGSCSVTATSVADPTKSATAIVTVTGGGFTPAPSYVSITNVGLAAASGGTRRVSFDISWPGSWRGPSRPTGVAASDNWDATWGFRKCRIGGGAGPHATLAAGGHDQPAGSIVSVSGDRVGAFVYRSGSGSGTFSANGVGLQWDYLADGVATGASVEVVPFAIEMVYVPQGSFSLGSGGTGAGEFRAGGTASTPFVVGSQASLQLGNATGQLMWTASASSGSPSGSTNASFPTGFAASYVMKYQVTQGQYVDFLNTLSQAQADTRLHTGSSNRHAITGSGVGSYATSLPFVAMNYMSWADGAAFADWAGLRPLTELEFEKVARGPLAPVVNEYAWGSTSMTQATGLANAGTVSETPTPSGANANYWEVDNAIQGPVRVGSFAGAGRSRRDAGAGFYGALELSGNLWERPVTVANAEGRAFAGTHGDGALDASGNANVLSWPGPGAIGSGFRGGGWHASDVILRVSDRIFAADTDTVRYGDVGWRGARTAP